MAEPRALWLQRPPMVADCSVLAALLFGEANGDDAAAILVQRAVHAPTLLAYEVASVADKKLGRGARQEDVDTALADFDEQRIELHPVRGGCGKPGGALRPDRLRRRPLVACSRAASTAGHA